MMKLLLENLTQEKLEEQQKKQSNSSNRIYLLPRWLTPDRLGKHKTMKLLLENWREYDRAIRRITKK